MRELFTRVADLLRRRRLRRELQEELEFHRMQIEQERMADGSTRDDARRDARIRLGNPQAIAEAAADRWGFAPLDALVLDFRYAFRALRRSPAFSLGVIGTLSLGIGANAAMFDVTDRLMFRPLSNLRDPSTVHRLYMQTHQRNGVVTDDWMPYARYEDFRNWTTSFSAFAGFNERNLLVGSGELAAERRIAAVSASFFDLFDAPPVRGRYFDASEDAAPAGSPVAVLSHELWRTTFGGREVVGETLQIGSLLTTIVGVAHPSLRGVNDTKPPSVFIPINTLGPVFGGAQGAQQSVGYGNFWGSLLVRRKADVSIDAAARDASDAFRRSWEAQRAAQPRRQLPPAESASPRVIVGSVRPGGGPAPALEVQTAWWVSGVAVIVLLIACANLANLMLGRAVARRQETAMLTAFGAGRGRLLTRMLAETLILAVFGAIGALAVAHGSVNTIVGLLIPDAKDLLAVTSIRTLSIIGGVALGAGLLLGFVSLAITWRPSAPDAVRSAGRAMTARTSVLRAVLVGAQAALSLVLLAGAILFTNSLSAVRTMRYGYDASRVLLVNPNFRGPAQPPAQREVVRQRLLEAAAALPGVEAAAWKVSTPLGLNLNLTFYVDGLESVSSVGQFTAQAGTADYFRVMGTQILRGRGFTTEDRRDTPAVVIVSAAMASALWPGRDPIGQCLRFGSPTSACTTVIGVAEDVVQTSIVSRERYQYYLPLAQQGGLNSGTGLALRFRLSSADQEEPVRRALQPLMPGTSYVTTQPLEELVTRAQRSWRLGASMFTALSALALVVAAVGMYGVIRYGVAQRTREMGIRTALGATAADLVRVIVTPNLRASLGGVVLGTCVAIAAALRIQPLLYEQSAWDARAYGYAAVVLLVTSSLASVLPALRAARVPPSIALRAE